MLIARATPHVTDVRAKKEHRKEVKLMTSESAAAGSPTLASMFVDLRAQLAEESDFRRRTVGSVIEIISTRNPNLGDGAADLNDVTRLVPCILVKLVVINTIVIAACPCLYWVMCY